MSATEPEPFYLRYYSGHNGRFGHEFLEFDFKGNGIARYANNSNYRNDSLIRKEMCVSNLVINELKRIIRESEIMKEDDSKWPVKNKDGRQELEIRLGNEHISFETAKIGSLVDVQESDDPEGLRVFYYLVQDLKALVFSLIVLFSTPDLYHHLSLHFTRTCMGRYKLYKRSRAPSVNVNAIDTSNEYEVEKILDEKPDPKNLVYMLIIPGLTHQGTSQYLVKWKGYDDPSENTWEPAKNLFDCNKILGEWNMKKKRRLEKAAPSQSKRRSISKVKKSQESTPQRLKESVFHTIILLTSQTDEVEERINSTVKFVKATNGTMSSPRKEFLDRLYEIPGAVITLCNEVDDEPCPPGDFEFINGYRYSPNVKVPSPESMFGCEGCPTLGCQLRKPKACSCLDDLDEKHQRFAYNKDGKVVIPPRHLIIECNRYCSCGPDCASRVVQRGRLIPLEIFKTTKKGWAVRTRRVIQKGTFIDVYRGEVIDHEEAERRGHEQGSVYLFDLDFFFKDEDSQDAGSTYTIDARHCGNVSRFFNHSCDPNIAIWPVVGHELARTERLYELAFFAIRDIKIGEELCFNYHGEGNQKKEGQHGVTCYCGSEKCTREFFIL